MLPHQGVAQRQPRDVCNVTHRTQLLDTRVDDCGTTNRARRLPRRRRHWRGGAAEARGTSRPSPPFALLPPSLAAEEKSVQSYDCFQRGRVFLDLLTAGGAIPAAGWRRRSAARSARKKYRGRIRCPGPNQLKAFFCALVRDRVGGGCATSR
jgi:hypothetical protein